MNIIHYKNMGNYFSNNILRKKWKFIAITTVLVILSSIVLSLVISPIYKTHTELLVIQKQNDWAEAERIATVLAKAVESSSFLDKVIDSNFNVLDSFSKDQEKRKEEWQNVVEAKVVKNTGIIEVDVYQNNKIQTERISYAISNILMKEGNKYYGEGNGIEVTLFEKPITTDKPIYPNMLLNIVISFILGISFAISAITIFPNMITYSKKKEIEPETDCLITNLEILE